MVALNRQEPANKAQYKTAAEEITTEFNIPIFSIATFKDIIEFTQSNKSYEKFADLLIKNQH